MVGQSRDDALTVVQAGGHHPGSQRRRKLQPTAAACVSYDGGHTHGSVWSPTHPRRPMPDIGAAFPVRNIYFDNELRRRLAAMTLTKMKSEELREYRQLTVGNN